MFTVTPNIDVIRLFIIINGVDLINHCIQNRGKGRRERQSRAVRRGQLHQQLLRAHIAEVFLSAVNLRDVRSTRLNAVAMGTAHARVSGKAKWL